MSNKLSAKIIADIKRLSYRAARRKYNIGTETVRKIKEGQITDWHAFKHGRAPLTEEQVAAVYESVRRAPHWNTAQRAANLGLRCETVQKILADAKPPLTRLNARLQFAGYKVEAIKPLAMARRRRILAARPGSLLAQDYKTYGMVRRLGDSPARRIGGYLCIDYFTGYATVHVAEKEDAENAVKALDKFLATAPFSCNRAVVLTDNGKAYHSTLYEDYCRQKALIHRFTLPYHPWQNGKAEAFNKTLKYQCFPVICGIATSYDQLQPNVDRWLEFYNTKRIHSGWNNKGLPPLALYELWKRAPGNTNIDKLINIGLIKPKDFPYIRIMGTASKGSRVIIRARMTRGVPIAYVIDKNDSFVPKGLPYAKTAATKQITLQK